MWPSFSLCACRILKIRSCLRSPLAPGKSSVRAMRVSSVMFFSLSSAMVMFTYGEIFKGGQKTCCALLPERRAWEALLCSPTLRLCNFFRFSQDLLPVSNSDAVQYLVHSFLDAGIGPVKSAGGLGGKLTQHIPVAEGV